MLQDLFMRYPQGKARALTFSYDDGVVEDIRLMRLLSEHGLKGTFNLNSGLFAPEGETRPQSGPQGRLTEREAVAAFTGTPHEVGLHGLTHPFLEQMSPARQAYEILEDRRRLEALFHTLVRGGAYPFGTYNEDTVRALALCGVAYCRTVASSHGFEQPADWLRLSPTCHHGDPQLFPLATRFLAEPAAAKPLLFYVWGHSYEFAQQNNWDVMERFCEQVAGREDVCYATNLQLCDYTAAFRALQSSCDGRLLHNPTATAVWYSHLGQIGCIQPGETRALA